MVSKICSITIKKGTEGLTHNKLTEALNNYQINNPNDIEIIENYGPFFPKFGTLLFIRRRHNNIVFKYGMRIFGKKEKQLRKTISLLERLLPHHKLKDGRKLPNYKLNLV